MKIYGLTFVLSVILVVVLVSGFVQAAGYIKFDGVDGESKDDAHKNWIDITGFSQSIHQPTTPGAESRRSGGVVFEDITVKKELDKSSPKLTEALVKGKVFEKVEIHFTDSLSEGERIPYYTYELKNVRIISYSISGDADDRPTEEISFNYEEIKTTYKEIDEAGVIKSIVEFLWNLVKSRAL